MKDFWKSAGRWLPGMLFSLAAIVVLLMLVDLDKLAAALRSADWRFLAGGLAVIIPWLLVRGLVWRTLLQNKASYKHTLLTICEGYLLNNIFPFRLGEVGRPFLLSRKAGLPFMEVFSTVVIERVLDLAFSAAILLAGVWLVVEAAGEQKIASLMGGLMVLGLVLLYLLARNREWAVGRFERLSARWPVVQRLGGRFLTSFFTGLGVLTEGWLFVRALFWMVLDAALAVLQYFLFIRAFFPAAPWTWAVLILGATAFGGAIPSLPGAIGTFEAAFGGALMLVTGDQAASLAAALVSHLLGYLGNGLLGAIAFSTEGETLIGVYRQLRNRQSTSE